MVKMDCPFCKKDDNLICNPGVPDDARWIKCNDKLPERSSIDVTTCYSDYEYDNGAKSWVFGYENYYVKDHGWRVEGPWTHWRKAIKSPES